MSDPEYDPEFEAYLRRRVHLDRRLHSLARLEPPEELDRIIIGKARQAIRPSPSVPHFRAPKWAVPLGMAACLFMSFSLILDVGLRQATRHDALSAPLVLEMTNPAAAVPEGAPAVAPGLEEPIALAGRSHFNSVRSTKPKMALNRAAAPMAQSHRAAAPVAALPPAVTAPAAAAAPPAATPAAESYASSHDESLEAARGGGGYEPAAIRLAANPPEMETVVVIATRWRRPVDSSASSAISVQSLSNFPADEARLQPPPIPDLPASLQGDGRSVRSAASANLSGSASPVAEAERRAHPDPKAWLDHIEKMQAVGLSSAAEQEMRLFRDAYPAYPVP